MMSLRSSDAAEMTIAGYLEGRQLVTRHHDFVQQGTRRPLVYGRPNIIAQDIEIPAGESREFRVEGRSNWGFLVHAVKLYTDDQDGPENIFNNNNISIRSIRVHADQEAIYGEGAGRNEIPAELWSGVTSAIGGAAAPRDTWHYLPYPLTVYPNRTLRIVCFNRGDNGEAAVTIRLAAAAQYLIPA